MYYKHIMKIEQDNCVVMRVGRAGAHPSQAVTSQVHINLESRFTEAEKKQQIDRPCIRTAGGNIDTTYIDRS